MSHAISDEALDTIFRAARSHNRWSDEPVSAALLMAVYDLMRWGPTSGNITPARFLFLTSTEAKLRLKPYLDEGNKEKSMTAPVVTIIGYDLDFPETLAKLKPRSPTPNTITTANPNGCAKTLSATARCRAPIS